MHSAGVAQALVGDDDGVLGEQGHGAHVRGPDHVLHERRGQLPQHRALLNVEKHHLQEERSSLAMLSDW